MAECKSSHPCTERALLTPGIVCQCYRNYVDQATALGQNLTYASGDTLILRADDTTVLSASGPGRSSVRLMSNKVYSNHVTVWVPHGLLMPLSNYAPTRWM